MPYICVFNIIPPPTPGKLPRLFVCLFFGTYLNGKDSLFCEDSKNIENSGKSFVRATNLPII